MCQQPPRKFFAQTSAFLSYTQLPVYCSNLNEGGFSLFNFRFIPLICYKIEAEHRSNIDTVRHFSLSPYLFNTKQTQTFIF